MTKNTYCFSNKEKQYEIFFAKDGFIELYEVEDPGKTGFYFDDYRQFNFFLNGITDIMEKKMLEIDE
jgi:hypothetical protein